MSSTYQVSHAIVREAILEAARADWRVLQARARIDPQHYQVRDLQFNAVILPLWNRARESRDALAQGILGPAPRPVREGAIKLARSLAMGDLAPEQLDAKIAALLGEEPVEDVHVCAWCKNRFSAAEIRAHREAGCPVEQIAVAEGLCSSCNQPFSVCYANNSH